MQRIESIDDPRVGAYRNLRDRTLRGESLFVAEGRVLVTRLLESRYDVESVFVADEFAGEFAPRVPEGVPVYVASERLLLDVVGFKFHRGVLAVGRRGRGLLLEEMLGAKKADDPLGLAICPHITKPENIGLVFRAAAGLGIDGVLLGEMCCDPFSRRCLRVSMGATLAVPVVKSTDLLADLGILRDRWRVELLAATLDPHAERLGDVRWPLRVGILFGNEVDGLSDRWLDMCPRRVTIPMQPSTDSLNLGVAAGIFMYEMMKSRSAGADKVTR